MLNRAAGPTGSDRVFSKREVDHGERPSETFEISFDEPPNVFPNTQATAPCTFVSRVLQPTGQQEMESVFRNCHVPNNIRMHIKFIMRMRIK